ncbi:unnamed protein product [Rotaria sordida]|uniref:Uncharacterized protein n=1 Tax=Rotaria sordida TaxID=392033 RepID=A0A814SZU6_9BILA|nr:unnamed protein product [Rotaria sordida]
MLENSSDHNDSSNHQHDNVKKENMKNNQRSIPLTRQVIVVDDNWIMKPLKNENKFIQSTNQGEATLLETEQDETSFVNSNQRLVFSSDHSKSVNTVNKMQQSRNINTFSPHNLNKNTEKPHSISKTNNMQSSSSLRNRTKTNIIPLPKRTSTFPINKITNIETRKSISRIPVPSNSSSRSISHSPSRTKDKRQISSTSRDSAFHLVTRNDHQKQMNSKIHSLSNSNNSSFKDNRKRITNSDDDDHDPETDNLNQDDLKLKLKEEKRHGKKKGELLNKLHESYEELLEKYAHAENTIDQLRFQPKIFNENTPRSTTSEHHVHIIQQPTVNIATLRSSGVYHSTTGSPFSSIIPVTSTTTTTTTPVRKSVSPAYSEELKTPETYKFNLLGQTKTLGHKMKSFLTLMDADQLSLAEQKQVYDNIKQDYEKLIQTLDRKKYDDDDLHNINLDGDLNEELEIMKQLLKEIVQRITENLLGKSIDSSSAERNIRLIHDDSHSSQLSARSSLCNHNDLMDQYQKLLNAVNTENTNKNDQTKMIFNELETDSKQIKTTSHDSSQSSLFDHHPTSTTNKQKPYVYVSGDSDDEQQPSSNITPIPTMKSIESTSFEPDYISSSSVKYHQHRIEEQPYRHVIDTTTKKKNEHENVEKPTKTKGKIKIEQKKIKNDHQYNKQSNPLIPSDRNRYTNNSLKTRSNDYDSGIGTNNITKLSYDSKLYTSTMDESHFQSFDDGQESMSSSHSSSSDFTSSGRPYSKYTNRFDSSPSNRRKLQDPHSSDIETHVTGSFDPIPQTSSFNKRINHNYNIGKPQKTPVYYNSRGIPFHRSTSIGNNKMKYSHSVIVPKIHTQQNLYYQQTIPITQHQPRYRSSLYINHPHTNKYFDQYKSNNLYLDSQTGIIYRYESNKNQYPTKSYCGSPSQSNLYECAQCGSITTYHHRHHINSTLKRTPSYQDDPGYESGYKKRNHRHRCMDEYISSSDSDSDTTSNYLDIIELNEAYNRAEKVRHNSQSLSRHINRQLKLALAAI